MFRGNTVFDREFKKQLEFLKLKQPMPLDEWSEKYIYLSSTYASEVGLFSCDTAPFQRQILRDMGDELLPQGKLILCCSSQIGKSQMLSNFLIYTMVNNPAPTLYVHYSLKSAQSYMKQRFRSMLRDIPILKGMVDMDGKKAGNTLDTIMYPGGSISHVGSNSPGNLSARSVRYLLLDEVDRMSNNSEGDPVAMSLARVRTFRNKKILMVSSPANLDDSKIWWEFKNTDQRYYNVPCPHCKEKQVLDFKHMKWNENASQVWMECVECKGKIEQKHRYTMLLQGEWIATDDTKEVHGYHINELYSPFSEWTDIVARFLEANELAKQGDYSKLQVFRNTTLALPYENDANMDVDLVEMQKRVEDFSRDPKDYYVTTLGLDTQDSRVEGLLIGWGKNEESWILDRPIFPGNPSLLEFWEQVENYIINNNVTCTNIDSGGHNTDAVYQFCKKNIHNKVYAIKGSGDNIRSVCDYRPSFKNRYSVPLFFVGTISAKTMLYQRAKLTKKDGGGTIHWNKTICTEEFFQQFFGEKMVKSAKTGRAFYEPVSTKQSVEVLDCFVYALHALKYLNVNWDALIQNRDAEDAVEDAKIKEQVTAIPQQQQQQQQQMVKIKNQKSYVGRW